MSISVIYDRKPDHFRTQSVKQQPCYLLMILMVICAKMRMKKTEYVGIRKTALTLYAICRDLRDQPQRFPVPLWGPSPCLFFCSCFQTELWLVWEEGHPLAPGTPFRVLRALGNFSDCLLIQSVGRSSECLTCFHHSIQFPISGPV